MEDSNKRITKIQYNPLNLPLALQFTNGNRTDYLYDSDGIKHRVTYSTAVNNVSVPMGEIRPLSSDEVSTTHTVDYCGNVIYEGGNLSKILTEVGYITLSGTSPTYHYYLKDHQGNNRVVTYWDGSKWVIEQVNHYYPFGGLFAEGTSGSSQPYKYNGKELDRTHGLDWYDYSARHYDAGLGRFMTMDPLVEKYYSMSPYAYCLNNPMRYIDLNGRDVWEIDSEGNVVKRIEDKSQDAFFMVKKGDDGNYQRAYKTDKDGNKIYDSINFKYGTVSQLPTFKDYDRYTVSGNENGNKLFEFLADNTNVEWGNIQYYTDESTITTSYQKASLNGNVTELFDNFSSSAVKSVTHSHPSGTPYPSGLDNRRSDIGAAKRYENRYGSIDLYIYLPGNDKYVRENYIQYNSNSDFFDFRNNPYGFTLPTVTIIGRRKY